MDLKSGTPFWALKNGLLHTFAPLAQDLHCDVAVLGAGITGALIADEFATHGHTVIVLDERDVGWGSTSSSTALLQYEIDTHLTDLAEQYGLDNGLLAYRACVEAIDLIADKAHAVKDVDFAMTDSLYYASKRGHRKDLREEFELRAKHDFPVQWLESDAIRERYGFEAPAAILSAKAARIDPYRMAYRLLMRLQKQGVAIHDRTGIARIQAGTRDVLLTTVDGCQVRAKHLVMATGYAAQTFLRQDVAKNRSSYAFITEPLPADMLGALQDTLLWESARPYLYMRTTGEGRLLIGGEDDAVDIPAKRDSKLDAKTRALRRKAEKLLPHLDAEPAFAWAGTFAETEDGLPFFGPHPQHGPRVHFAMAYGGNGITYSMLGGGLLRALVERRKHPLQHLFSFDRVR